MDGITNSMDMSLSKLLELVIPSNHLILRHPLLLQPSVFPSIRVFSKEAVHCIRWPKYWSFTLSIFGILQRIFRTDFYQDGLGGSLCSPRDFQVQFSRSVMSDSSQPCGLQHARLPCPSPNSGACSNSCPSSWRCHPLSSPSLPAFSLSQHQGLFQ